MRKGTISDRDRAFSMYCKESWVKWKEDIRLPFVLKHDKTSQIFTCTLVNHYQLAYYGTKYWDDESEALAEFPSFLRSQAVDEIESWQLYEISDNELKLCNVKLKNDPRLILLWDEETQKMTASNSPSKP